MTRHGLKLFSAFLLAISLLVIGAPASAQSASPSSSDFSPRETGDGPFETLIIRGAFMIDGLGGPAQGPMVITVENNRIARIQPASQAPAANDPAGARVIDATGKYILPGFINGHGHLHSVASGEAGRGPTVPSQYIAKLWLAHGITTVRELGSGTPAEWLIDIGQRSARNEILAPRIYSFPFFGALDLGRPVDTPDDAREYVRKVADLGVHGIKFLGGQPDILEAAIEEATKRNLQTTMHHAQITVVDSNVLDTSALGLGGMQHWYGLPEALFTDRVTQDYKPSYIYQDEQDRFSQAGELWAQAAGPGTERWDEVMDTLLARNFDITPTFSIYVANRNWMAARRAEWHDTYTLPDLWDWYRPSNVAHGSYWFDWTQDIELAWAENFRLWMRFINEYKNRGGLVGVGEDAGYIYSTYGFGYIKELELLREAGFHPLEVIRSATSVNATILGIEDELGSIRVGKLADLVIVPENPLHNFKTLYATGHPVLNRETGNVERIGGVETVIKDGIIYDAVALRQEIAEEVSAAKIARNIPAGPMPVETPQ
ncbi:MAG: amidohydrolase family protein [Hyphomonadaceae bacterium]